MQPQPTQHNQETMKEIASRREFAEKLFDKVQRRKETGAKLDKADLTRAVFALKALTEAQDKLMQLLIQESITTARTHVTFETGITQIGCNYMAMARLLVSKGMITDDELKESWAENVQPILDKRTEQEESQPEEEVVEDDDDGLPDPQDT